MAVEQLFDSIANGAIDVCHDIPPICRQLRTISNSHRLEDFRMSTGMRYAFAALALLLCAAGCSKESALSSSGLLLKRPGVGSRFTYNHYEADGSGKMERSDLPSTAYSVVATGLSFHGMENLIRLHSDGFDQLVDYRSDGDLAYITERMDYPDDYPWKVYPVGSGKTILQSAREIQLDRTVILIPKGTIRYAGEERITVAAGTFDTRKIVSEYDYSMHPMVGINIERDTLWIAPSIGMSVRHNRWFDSSMPPAESLELAEYELK
jgi:hypothetical protein